MNTLHRVINPEVRIVDAKAGIVDYVASDESIDSYREVIRANGWRFDFFRKNAPLVDSHDYSSIDKLVGKVLDFSVEKGKLIERAQWAIDVAENRLAQIGWKMTEAGYLRAVSVGFWPTKLANRWDMDRTAFDQQITELGLQPDQVRTIYLEQQQVELSTVILGANPNALAKSYKADLVTDADLDFIARSRNFQIAHPDPARLAQDPDAAARAKHLAREAFLDRVRNIIKNL